MNASRSLHDRLGAMIDQVGQPDYSLRELVDGLREIRDELYAVSETAPLVAGDLKTQREIHDSYAPSATLEKWVPMDNNVPLAQWGLCWAPSWRHPYPGMRNGDHGACWVDTCEPEAKGWQTFATHWMPFPEAPHG